MKDLPEPGEFNEKTKFIKGNNMAKASMEMLLYDYYAKYNKKPLVDYIGHSRGYANVGISLGMDDINVTLKKNTGSP
jgi:Mandelate racemase / muconate lactonizing enzyme, N-terminal domain.